MGTPRINKAGDAMKHEPLTQERLERLCTGNWQAEESDSAAMAQEILELRRDCDRLDWLISAAVAAPGTAEMIYIRRPMNDHGWRIVTHDADGYPATRSEGETPRAAIDAAMAPKKEQG